MKKIRFLLNSISGVLLVFSLTMAYSPETLIADTSSSSTFSVVALCSIFVIQFIITPAVTFYWKEHEWNLLSLDEKVQILSADLTSGVRYWAIKKYANSKYYFDPVLQGELSENHLGTDPLKLRNLLLSDQIENLELAEGILRRLGYWEQSA